MPLFELRRSRGVSQIGLSQLLRMDQPNLSKLEHRDDHLVSTLDTYVAALGGRLRILVDFPDEPPIRLVSAPKPRQRRKRR
jgi:transcriptional regulator with XRE-family HTH domain